MMRRVYRERAMALAGPRALLMQAAHPLAVSGLLAHTSALDEPYERLARTAEVMSTITFGTRADADRVTRGVRAMHGRVSGSLKRARRALSGGHALPRVRPGPADVGALHARRTAPWSCTGSTSARMSRAAQAELWDDYRIVGRLFGLRASDMPETLSDFERYGREMLAGDELHVTDWARTRARRSCSSRPCRAALRPVVEAVNFITITLLPERIRREYGFRALPPAWARRAIVSGGAEYVKRAVIPFLPERLRVVPAARAA